MGNPKLNEKLISWFLLGFIILLAAALRFYDLGGESYWYDEVIMVNAGQKDLGSIIQGGRPPVYVSLAHFWIKFFGTSEDATRSLSALAGILAIPLIYMIGQLLFDRRVGLIGAFLMAISQFQIYYSQDFRYYSLFVLMTLFSFLFFIQALKKRRLIYFVFYVLATISMFYTHTFGVFIIAAQAIYYLLSLRRYRNLILHWFLSQIVILLAMLPSIINIFDKAKAGKSGPSWLPDPSFWTPLITIRNYVGSGLDYPTWFTLFMGLSFFLFGTLLFAVWKGRKQRLGVVKRPSRILKGLSIKRNELLLVSFWLLVPILLPFILSKVLGPMYHDRYTICASPALYILVALVITNIKNVVPEIISLGLIVIVIAPGLHEFYVRPVKEQWREAAAFVEKNEKDGDIIILAGLGKTRIRDSFNWYYRGDLPECRINNRPRNDQQFDDELDLCLKGSNRLWVVVREVPFPYPMIKSHFLDYKLKDIKLIEEREFTKLTVYLFQI